MNTAREFVAGSGTQTSGLGSGGYGPTTVSALVESWDGTNWTETTEINTARSQAAAVGTGTASLLFGGDEHPGSPRLANETESWNGTTWTELNNLNTARRLVLNSGFGRQSQAILAGGYSTTRLASVEAWNGTSWSEINDLSSTQQNKMGVGAGVAGMAAGGYTTTAIATNEEFNVSDELSTVTVS